MEISIRVMLGLILGALPFFGLLLWWWNDILYVFLLKFRFSHVRTKLPPGYMGLPIIGEMPAFLWYFKFIRRPDEFINAKRRKYGDGVGIYRTYLFGSPCIIACFPSINKFVFQSNEEFILDWPTVEIMGSKSIVAVQGKAHTRLRTYVSNAINRPDALGRIALHVQPGIVAGLKAWAQKGKIKVSDETKKVTFENIGKLFVSLEPGPLLVTIDNLFDGLMKGFRATPLKIPGTAYHYAVQCRKKLEAIFRVELEKKKKRNQNEVIENDLMDGLMQMKDEEGNELGDEEVLDNIISLVVAGYESTALASMWAIYYLPKYPKVLQKLRDENLIVSKKKKGGFITSQDVSNMEYTNKVVQETIRMANVSAFQFRTVTKDVEYKGYTIPKNWKVMLWIRYLHTDSNNYDDPMCFNPDRWDKPAKSGTFYPFGGGPRMCAGNMLARIQVAILLHHLSIGYKWELVNPNADIIYLSHPSPADGVELVINKLP